MRSWVRQVMGTAVSIAAWTEADGARLDETAAAVELAFAELRSADERFSPFKPDSQISRLRDGTTTLERCDLRVREVLALCERLRQATGGYFDAYAAGPDQLDPCGVVKGWAAERASDVLVEAGVPAHYVNAGGDVRLRGQPARNRLWRVGIADPHHPGELIATVHSSDLAIATSGTAERGAHVLDPHRGVPAVELAGVTVVGPSLTLADAYATAAFAMGPMALEWLAELDGYEGLLVGAAGDVRSTPGFP
jgi:thiamine biosynthesis lipoprotein